MRTVILAAPGAIPSIFEERTNDALLARLQTVKSAPPLETVADAKSWLATLALPSGWFASRADALAFAKQCRDLGAQPMTGRELRSIREMLGMTREAFAEAIGYAGNPNTRHKQIFQMENDERTVMPDRAVRARALFATHQMAVAPR